MVAACWVALLLWAAAAFALGKDGSAANYNIYRSVADWVNATGGVPGPGQILDRAVPGVYADFTALNLWIYRVLFSPESLWVEKLLFLAYQAGMFATAVWLLITRRGRLGLSVVESRAAAALVVSPMVAGSSMVLLDDKAAILTVALMVLVASAPWWRAAATGLAAAWTGAAILALPLALVPSRGRRPDLRAAATGGVVFVAGTLAAGTASAMLLSNRSARESMEPFAFSVWRALGDLYSPVLRLALLGVVAIVLVASAYRRVLPWNEAFVALVALLFLASTNTVPSRVAGVLVLGVLVFRTARGRLGYLAVTAAWAAGTVTMVVLRQVTDSPLLAGARDLPWWQITPVALVVNSLLLAVVGVPAVRALKGLRAPAAVRSRC